MKQIVFFGVVILGLFLTNTSHAQDYDLVILNGRVMDPETNFDAVRNVGIKDGKIAIITSDDISGTEIIDASGHVVSPGFIEGHQHATDPFSRKVALRDGLTTMMDFEAGIRDADKWYSDAEGKTQNNYGAVVCAMFARISVLDGPEIAAIGNDAGALFGGIINAAGEKAKKEGRPMGWSNTLPDKDQMNQILKIVDEALRQGALGVGIPVGYMTNGLSSYEMFKYQELAAKYGRVANGHTRFAGIRPPTEGVLGIQEMLLNAVLLEGAFMGAHLNSVQDWEYSIPLINRARAMGVKTWGEVYPYAAGSTIASTDVIEESNMKSLGITYSDITNASDGKRWDKATYEDVRKNDPGRPVIIYNNPKEAVAKWLAMPDVVVVSDGMPIEDEKGQYYPWDSPYEGKSCHPRSAGPRAKVLRMVREDNIMPLMEAISKMSYLHAKFFEELGGIPQFRFKGRVQVGADADIVVFDPKTVTDNATYKAGEGALPSTGIPYVVVNGVTVVKDSKVLKDVYPGKPIRFPVLPTGKLDELDIDPRKFE